ncbi:MAG: cation diffusion facilitator family transporter [Xanthobacteraceae bacterium]|jgi:cobalt-zinc-cadmium efflux system protein
MTHDHHEHDHDHHAGHDHGHSHAPTSFGRVFAIGVTLNLVIVAAELVFGYLANSLSLISDAAHNFTDVVGLLLAWGGAWLAARQPTARYTYGFRRASILAALGNAALLLIATGGILIEALHRFQDPQPVATGTVMAVATLGILVNGATAVMFMSGRKDDLNIKGAFLHMVGDAGISVGVVIGAALVSVTGWLWLDPAISVAIALAVLWSSWGLARDSVNLALDAIPRDIDHEAVQAYLRDLPGVSEVHDLHIWAMSTTETALTAHLVRPGASLDDQMLHETCRQLELRFKIKHATLQIEAGNTELVCRLAPAHIV